jgi:hypothetical protein
MTILLKIFSESFYGDAFEESIVYSEIFHIRVYV